MEMTSSVSTRLHYQHKTLLDLIDGFTDEQVRRNIIPGKWSVFETIVHLQTYQHKFISRVKQILDGGDPVFSRYTAESDPLFHDNCTRSVREIMQDLISIRKGMTAEMVRFSSDDLAKCGVHPFFGKMTLIQWINFFLLHEAHHLFAIFRMGAELKKAAASG